MESNITEKDCCRRHGKQTAGFFVNLLINILIVCVGTFYLIQFSQEQQSLKDLKTEVSSLKQEVTNLQKENQELKGEVIAIRKVPTGDGAVQNMTSGELVKREVLSSPSALVQQFEQKMSGLQLDVQNIDDKMKRYHPLDADLSCPSNYRLNPFSGTCFRYVKVLHNWDEAKSACIAAGDNLATFGSVDSSAWYRQQQLTGDWKGHSWIGGRKVGTTWKWHGLLTGPVAISYWGLDEPNKSSVDCMGTYTVEHYYWDDWACSQKRFYACERKATS